MKQAPDFEGISYGGAEYASGFGVIAEPTIEVETLTEEDEWLVVTSDGLFSNVERGGGDGIDNDGVAALAAKVRACLRALLCAFMCTRVRVRQWCVSRAYG